MRVTVDYRQVYRAQIAVNILVTKDVSGVAKIALRRFARNLARAIEDIDPERNAILEKYAKVEDGAAPVFHGDEAEAKVNEARANVEFWQLQGDAKVEIECIEASVFEYIDGEGVTALMLELGDLVFDPEDLPAARPERKSGRPQ